MKIVFLIKPNKEITNLVNFWKKKIKNYHKNTVYLLDIPHLTLFTAEVKNIKSVIDRVKLIIRNLDPITLQLNNTFCFKNDLLTGGNTIMFKILKNSKLFDMQYKIANSVKNYVIDKKKIKNFKGENLKSFRKYGFPYIGKHWIPHITICSIIGKNDNRIIKKFLKIKINKRFMFSEVFIYKVLNKKMFYIKKINLNEKN